GGEEPQPLAQHASFPESVEEGLPLRLTLCCPQAKVEKPALTARGDRVSTEHELALDAGRRLHSQVDAVQQQVQNLVGDRRFLKAGHLPVEAAHHARDRLGAHPITQERLQSLPHAPRRDPCEEDVTNDVVDLLLPSLVTTEHRTLHWLAA